MNNKQLNQEKRKYLNEVRSYFISDQGTRNKFIRDLKSDIDGFIEENAVTDFKSVYDRFGKPQDIAKGFFENADIKKIKRKMNITRVVLIAVVMALVMFAAFLTVELINANWDHTGYNATWIGDASMQLIDFMYLGDIL